MAVVFSLYLDLGRILAAFAVFLTHAGAADEGYIARFGLDRFGHDAVVYFFVMSGFVVSYAVHYIDKNAHRFIVNRLARLYSVLLPSIVLIISLRILIKWIDPIYYASIVSHSLVVMAATQILFIHQIWFWELAEGPSWSIGYEFWYYVMFGVWTFTQGRKRAVFLFAIALFVGPKILVLLPIWVLGAFVQRVKWLPSKPAAYVMFFGSFIAYGAFRASGLSEAIAVRSIQQLGLEPLGIARYFMSDYVVAALVAGNMLGFKTIQGHFGKFFLPFEATIRFAASFTFSLYLYHYILLQALSIIFPRGSYWLLPATLAIIMVLGVFTEHRKLEARRVVGEALNLIKPLARLRRLTVLE
jgi:peptidoglycan/LPS O-acetylase OafA/YrhL